ncbi:MAG: EscU/YscU/HrcU family type III secretion system export apparatus switch protein [Granulosicoccus sp.]
MSQPQESGDKTEKATPKKLRDARKRGEVANSRDLTSTLGLAFSLSLIFLGIGYASREITELFDHTLKFNEMPIEQLLVDAGLNAMRLFIYLSAMILLPVAAVGMLIDFLQIGAIFSMDKVKPSMEKINLAEGIKRMFRMDNMVELVKNVVKTVVLGAIGYFVVRSFMGELVTLPASIQPMAVIGGIEALATQVLAWTLGIFLFLMVMDSLYQKHSFAKRMRMSIRDIRQEQKQTLGDPLIKQQRRQMHKEYAQEGRIQAAGEATVLVVNPTHVAIAIRYDRESEPVPIVSAKAEDADAAEMREAANQLSVPVLRNELLARMLLADVEEGEIIPRSLFDVIAEVILWANRTKDVIELQRGERSRRIDEPEPPEPPGEDLTSYPIDTYRMDINLRPHQD